MSQKIIHEFKCDQPSSSFTKTDGGDYCRVCNTVVIDFTNKTNEEILGILSANNNHVCGSAYKEQLNNSASLFGTRNKVAAAGLAAILGCITQDAYAKNTRVPSTEIVYTTNSQLTADSTEVAGNIPEAIAIEAPDKPDKKEKVVRRKTFLKIGRRRFYTMNIFPFIGSSRAFYGRYRAV